MSGSCIDLPDLESHQRFGRVIAGLLVGGDIVALRGELGAGKTTLMRVISGLGLRRGVGVSTASTASVMRTASSNAPPGRRGLGFEAWPEAARS